MKVLLMSVIFSVAGIIAPVAAQAVAQSYQLNIPKQPLDAALKDLAQQTGLQIGRLPDRRGGAPVVGPVNGEMSVEKALHTLLAPTQFTYKVVNDSTIAVLATSTAPYGTANSATQNPDPGKSGANDAQKEGKNPSSQDFRVAQVDQATPPSSSPINSAASGSQAGNIPLTEIVVTAQKRQERLQDVPISISVLGGDTLDKSTFSGVTDALNTVPGVAAFPVQVQTGGTMLSIRGVSAGGPQGAGASTVGYYIDSVPFGQIRNSLVPDPNVYDLSQIEVLRGPQGTLYGANALVGVIRVMTNDPDLNNFDFKMSGAQSTTEYGGGNYGGNAAVNVPIVDGILGIRAAVGDEHESGWINGPLGTHLNSGELSNARIKLSARPTDDFSVVLSAWHSQQRYASPAESDGNRDVSTTHPQPMDTEFNAYGARLVYDPSMLTLTSMTSYITYTNNNIFDLSGVGDPQTFFTGLPSRVFAEEVNLTSKGDGPWRWSAGTMYRDAKDSTYQYYTNYPEPTTTTLADNFHDTSRSVAVYGELGRFFLDRKFEAAVGLRYFHDDEATQANSPIPGLDVPLNRISATSSATTPRAVLSWFPKNNLTAYATYSQGFRSGIPQDELVGTSVQSFPAAKPDKLNNYELGIKGSFLDGLFAYDAAVYYMDWKDIQQQLQIPIPGGAPGADAFVLVNANTVRGEGTEFSLKTKPIEALTVAANFSWNNLHFTSNVLSGGAVLFTEGSRPNQSPEYTAGLAVDYSFPIASSGITGILSVSGNYISELNISYLNGSNLSDLAGNSLVLTKGSFTVQFPQHWDVALFVDNANNWSGTQSVAEGLPQYDARLRPRTYGIRFDYHLL